MRKEQHPLDLIFGDLAKILGEPGQLVSMPVDVRKTEGKLELHVHVPGVKREEISIDFDHRNNLVISVERSEVNKEHQDGWLTIESSHKKSMKRQFVISEDIDKESIEATLNDGVLLITLKEKAKQEPVKIQIK